MNISIPELENQVAPCFEAATHFVIAEISAGQIRQVKRVECPGTEGYRRIRLLKVHNINVVICNGIKGFYRDLLHAIGIKVLPDISLAVEETLEHYLAGLITVPEYTPDDSRRIHDIPLDDLVSWARLIFESNGYEVAQGPGQDSFLIDLVATVTCPVCKRQVKVAICCGAHTYRIDQELREFHYCAKSDYNARVFICPDDPQIEECSKEYGIEYIRFEPALEPKPEDAPGKIPLLRSKVNGHEKAVMINTDLDENKFFSEDR